MNESPSPVRPSAARHSAAAPAPAVSRSARATPAVSYDDEADKRFRAPDIYDPADYRWVPVRRRPRLDGWTDEKQRRFIEVLADTGLVRAAAKEVGLSPQSAYQLRRAAHGEAFARAWDAARHHAGAFLEDVAFERAIEGGEQNIYNEFGEVVCTKRVYDNRLLAFLLRHLKPDRYAQDRRAAAESAPVTVEAALRAMEPQLPAPAQEMFDDDTLENDLLTAEIADGKLPHFFAEQRRPNSDAPIAAEAIAAQDIRGKAVFERIEGQGSHDINERELRDMCTYLDPSQRRERPKTSFK